MSATASPHAPRRRAALDVARAAAQEAVSRRLVLIGVVVSAVFVALFGLGTSLLARDLAGAEVVELAAAQTFLTVFGLYAVQFLASFLAIMLGSGAVAGELSSGRALSVLARPLPRWSWLLQRAGTFAALAAGYVVLMSVGVLVVADVLGGGYGALSPVRGIGMLVLQVWVVLALATALSTRLSVTAAGSITAALFGLAWLGGITELVGQFTGSDTTARVGVAISLVMPSDAVWRGASYYLSSPLFLGVTGSMSDGPPFLSTVPPNALRTAWAALHAATSTLLAVRWLARRDL